MITIRIYDESDKVHAEKEINVETGDFIDELSHAICMGIRKGLFGKDADDRESIKELSHFS